MSYIKPIVGALLFAPAVVLTSCNLDSEAVQSRKKLLDELMADKPIRQYEKVVAGWGNAKSYMKECVTQSSVDSVAYSDLFAGTELAKNSAAVAEFNAIAANTRPKLNSEQYGHDAVGNALDDIIKDMGITKRAYDANEKEYSKMKTTAGILGSSSDKYDKIIATKQFKADSVAYRQFFERHNILQTVEKELKNIARKVRP